MDDASNCKDEFKKHVFPRLSNPFARLFWIVRTNYKSILL